MGIMDENGVRYVNGKEVSSDEFFVCEEVDKSKIIKALSAIVGVASLTALFFWKKK